MQFQIPTSRKQIDQGATNVATHPTPPVSQPHYSYYLPRNQYYSTGPGTQIHQGATVLQVYSIDGSKMEYAQTRQLPKAKTLAEHGNVVVVVQADVYPVSKPEFSYYKLDVNRFTWTTTQTDGATTQQTSPIPPVSNPFFKYYKTETNRYQDQRAKSIEGATIQATYPIPPVSNPLFNYYKPEANRYQDELIKRFEGATIQFTFPVPPVSNPEFSYYKPESNRYQDERIKNFEGATQQATFPIPPVSQPDAGYYKPATNRYLDIVKLFDAATSQQTFIFPLSQPVPRNYTVQASDVKPPITVTVVATPFQPSLPAQPDYRYFTRNTYSDVYRNLDGTTQVQVYSLDGTKMEYLVIRQLPSVKTLAEHQGLVRTIHNYYTGSMANTKRMQRGMGF